MKRTTTQNLLLVAGSIAVAILLAEILLRIVGSPAPGISGWLYMGDSSEANELGFRGQRITYTDDDFVVVLLGDSQISADAVSFERMPEKRLEFYLNQAADIRQNVRVFSVGTGGYGQDQQLLSLRAYFDTRRADLVVLWQTPGNDVWNNVFPTHWPRNGSPKPTFWLVDDRLEGPSEEMLGDLNWTDFRLLLLLNKFIPIHDRDGRWESRLPPAYAPNSNFDGKTCPAWQDRWDSGRMRHENLANEKSHLSIRLTPRSPRMQYGLDLTKKLLGRIVELADGNGSDFVIFKAIKPRDDNTEGCLGESVTYALNGKYYSTSDEQFHQNFRDINSGLVSFDIPVTVADYQVGPNDTHLNVHANDQVMRDLAARIGPLLASR